MTPKNSIKSLCMNLINIETNVLGRVNDNYAISNTIRKHLKVILIKSIKQLINFIYLLLHYLLLTLLYTLTNSLTKGVTL